ncbi:hypothetical protein GOBAR_AA07507 [Gossypium barbadense]|uniref:Uncharacterized protein n=1 Tax=Gossypium barbadense TaxID=3634 RepID=A0A2P5YC76_GOSBA|nr:hypothetical protein GOBAR_AA07507 [Gossypium barbadense]
METREEQQLNLIPVSVVNNCEYGAESSSSFPSIPHSSSKENLLYLVQKQRYDSRLKLIGDSPIKAFYRVIRSWASKKFMTGCQLIYQILCWLFKFSAKESMILNFVRVILLPIAITFYTTWWFIHFVDDFSPQSISILGSAYLVDQKSKAFKEVAIIRHPRIGEYGFGFITSTVILHGSSAGSEELNCVYVPSNHLYTGDVFLISSNGIVRPNLSVREGIIVISGGMSVPRMLTTLDARVNEAIEIAGLENSTTQLQRLANGYISSESFCRFVCSSALTSWAVV